MDHIFIIINRIMSDKEHVSIVVCGHVDSGNCCVFVCLGSLLIVDCR